MLPGKDGETKFAASGTGRATQTSLRVVDNAFLAIGSFADPQGRCRQGSSSVSLPVLGEFGDVNPSRKNLGAEVVADARE